VDLRLNFVGKGMPHTGRVVTHGAKMLARSSLAQKPSKENAEQGAAVHHNAGMKNQRRSIGEVKCLARDANPMHGGKKISKRGGKRH